MDTVSPQALEHLCLDFVCENIENLCQEVPQGDGYAFPRLVFKRSTYLHEHLAEGLLNRLTSSRKLSSKILTLFLDGKTCRLKRVCIKNADVQDIVLKSLLTHHAISELDLSGVKVNLNPELGFSLPLSLQRLKLSNINEALNISLICQLKYLHHLDISRRNIGTEDMVHISCALPLLESLNISCTEVKDLKSLRNLQKSLKVLCAYNIPETWENPEVLAEFTLLQQLDLSRNPGNLERPNSDVKRLVEFLEKPGILPNLTHLDVSGMTQLKETTVQAFLDFHPKLQFLGLFKTNMSHVQFLPKQLKVTGKKTEKQVLASLEHYPDRAIYMKEALGCLYDFSENWTERRPEVLELVFQAMDMHSEKLEIQVVATACIYNLTRSNNADQEDIHITLLSKIAQVILPAMKEFPKSNELIRNSLLILDRPKLLMKAKLDRYLLASLAMDVVREFSSNLNIAKYAIKLCVVVSAEISAPETRLLGSVMNIETLVSVIKSQVDENSLQFGDSTLISLAFHLIWNFTDGAPDTCDLFVCRGGLKIAKKIINQINFIDNDGQKLMISRNIVGTLNNIAEVPELRHHLIKDEFMRILCNLLETPFGSLAFFSGGILSNLLLNWDDCIRLQYYTKGQILQKIENAVARGVVPGEMVAYRSFASFMPLILSNIPAVQLWALSGVIHVTSANSSRYIPMVENSGVLAFVESLLSSDTPQHQGVHRLAVKLSEMVKRKRAKRTAQI